VTIGFCVAAFVEAEVLRLPVAFIVVTTIGFLGVVVLRGEPLR
jgi:hypothetical protein